MPDPSTELPTLVVDPRTGRITVQEIGASGAGVGQPAQGRSVPTLGLNRPQGTLPPNSFPNMLEGGVLPALMGILAMPFSGGLSLPAAMGVTGGASALGEMASQKLQGNDDIDWDNIIWEGATGAAPTGLGRWANTSKRGTRMIESVVADGQPVRATERLTAAAKDSGITKLTSAAIDDIVAKTVQLENSMFDKMGKLIVTPKQAQAIKARIAKMDELVQHLRSLPVDKGSRVRLRLDPSGKVSAGVNILTDPSRRLATGQALDRAGTAVQYGAEGLTRGAMLSSADDKNAIEQRMAGDDDALSIQQQLMQLLFGGGGR